MTYKQLKEQIEKMSEEDQELDVTVYATGIDEVFPTPHFVTDWSIERDTDLIDEVDGILDHNHPFLGI
jgi:hypothetical protein